MYVIQHTNMKEYFNRNSRWPDDCKVNCTSMASGCEQHLNQNVTVWKLSLNICMFLILQHLHAPNSENNKIC